LGFGLKITSFQFTTIYSMNSMKKQEGYNFLGRVQTCSYKWAVNLKGNSGLGVRQSKIPLIPINHNSISDLNHVFSFAD
jgi:hypothetical protein